MKKRTKKNSSIFLCILFSILLVLLIIVYKDVLLNNYTDFYELQDTTGIQKDAYVSINIDKVLGNYAETKHYTNFVPTGTDQHFIIWLNDNNFISLTTKNKKVISQLNEIMNDTYEYIESKRNKPLTNTIKLKGIIHTLNPEIVKYYDNYLSEFGITAENANIYYYLTIDTTETFLKVILMLLFFALLLTLSIIWAVKDRRKTRNMNENNFTDNMTNY